MSDATQPQEQLTQDIADTPSRNPLIRWFGNHPKGFWFFFWGEFAERCSFYGMRAILAKYMADQLALGQDNAGTYMSFFIAACYFLPLLGGWVADNFFGKYWTIVGFSLPYILGHVILGVEDFVYLVVALTLLAMGSGVIKPNISTLMGLTYDQQRPGQTKLRSDAFAMFYFAINIGAAISQFALPPIRTNCGYAIAFLVPAGLMVVAFIIFALGKKYYGIQTIERKILTPEERTERWRVVGRIAGLFFLIMFFWAIFDQSTSTWVFFAEACMELNVFGLDFDPDQFQAFNSIFILLLLPPITLFIKRLERKGYRVLPTTKIMVGFIVTAACMGVMALAAGLAGDADLRPGVAQGENLALVVLSADRSQGASIEGNLTVTVAGDSAISIKRDVRVMEDGKERLEKVTYKISGEGVLKLAPSSKSETVRYVTIEGKIKKLELVKKDDSKITLAEGDLKAHVEGEKIGVQNRWFVEPANKVTVWWQILAYFVLTVAEVLISVTGLELGYTAAPKSMSGFVTGIWLVTVGMGNLVINAPVTRLYTSMQPVLYFGMLTALIVVVVVAFVPVARRFNRNAPTETPTE